MKDVIFKIMIAVTATLILKIKKFNLLNIHLIILKLFFNYVLRVITS